jgi:multiple sugar transport system ATP-binding protein
MNFAPVQISETNGAVWAASEGMRLKVPGQIADRLGRHVRSEVTMGIRPEDLHVASDADPAELGFEVMVEVIEKLGSEILLDVAVGSHTMVASVEPGVRANIHDRLRLAVNPDRLHFFDARTEAAI